MNFLSFIVLVLTVMIMPISASDNIFKGLPINELESKLRQVNLDLDKYPKTGPNDKISGPQIRDLNRKAMITEALEEAMEEYDRKVKRAKELNQRAKEVAQKQKGIRTMLGELLKKLGVRNGLIATVGMADGPIPGFADAIGFIGINFAADVYEESKNPPALEDTYPYNSTKQTGYKTPAWSSSQLKKNQEERRRLKNGAWSSPEPIVTPPSNSVRKGKLSTIEGSAK